MHCKVCNTRIGEGERHCANCGRAVSAVSTGARAGLVPKKLPLAPSSAAVEPVELEIDQRVGSAAAGSRRRTPAPAPGEAPAAPGGQRLRAMLAAEPELLEPDLRVYANEQGAPVGVELPTEVGPVDLLAVDGAGALVVVLVAEGEKGAELVPEILRRMGWVRKHLAQQGQEVRGVVLLESAPEDLDYAAAAVRETVSFKTFRMSLVFEELEI